MNNVVLECPRCLNMFVVSTMKLRIVGEKLRSIRCRCGNIVHFDLDYMDPVQLWALPNVANRIRKIEGYALRVEGLTYSRMTG
ncbi:MAG: hypothetical protein OK456_01440 [Thaumarchaeota archaeon]|nr:hypothetical protein [Nitrososphaerota archaeon]